MKLKFVINLLGNLIKNINIIDWFFKKNKP